MIRSVEVIFLFLIECHLVAPEDVHGAHEIAPAAFLPTAWRGIPAGIRPERPEVGAGQNIAPVGLLPALCATILPCCAPLPNTTSLTVLGMSAEAQMGD